MIIDHLIGIKGLDIASSMSKASGERSDHSWRERRGGRRAELKSLTKGIESDGEEFFYLQRKWEKMLGVQQSNSHNLYPIGKGKRRHSTTQRGEKKYRRYTSERLGNNESLKES